MWRINSILLYPHLYTRIKVLIQLSSQVTRALRARLSQASWKASNTGPHLSSHELDNKSSLQSPSSFSRANTLKRKAPGSGGYYNTSINTPNTSASTSNPRRPEQPRNHYPNYDTGRSANTPGSSSQTLFTSILAPPVAKQTRTIMNANDPPIAAPVRPAPSPRPVEHRGARTIAAPNTKGKGKKAASPETKRASTRGKRSSDKKRRLSAPEVDADGDVDMRAAATLTSLLYQHRPSVSGSAESPRSSIDDSETGSQQSFSQYAQSSARTIHSSTANTNAGSTPLRPNASTSSVGSTSQKIQTPPPPATHKVAQKQKQQQLLQSQQRQPKPAQPNDSEAADLMLFLATSPSPARPNMDAKDASAYRVLGGGNSSVRAKGRVLFPGPSTEPLAMDTPTRTPASQAGSRDSSFYAYDSTGSPRRGSTGFMLDGVSRSPVVSSPMRPAPGLLPPPPLSGPVPISPANRDAGIPRPPSAQSSAGDFNFSEYINASPNSPARGPPVMKTNLGLRADVGRKLFEEEQMRMSMNLAKSQTQAERGLEAGIDLVK
jgi:hypothetical protein